MKMTIECPCFRSRSTVKQRMRANSNWMKQLNSASFLTPIRAMNSLDQLLFEQALLMIKLDAGFYTAAAQLEEEWRQGGKGGKGFRHRAIIDQLLRPAPPAGQQQQQQGVAACGLGRPLAPARA
jgi:hypothetical protein